MCDKCLKWDDKERKELESRILKLKNEQIIEIYDNVGIKIRKEDWHKWISDIKGQPDSMSLDVLFREADSKENLRKWVKYFEK